MDRKLIAILVSGLVVMALTPWLAWPSAAKSLPLEERRFLHCPNCEKEGLYSQRAEDEGCKRCGPGFPLVATKEPLKTTGPPPNPYAHLLPLFLIEMTLLLAAILGYLYFGKSAKSDEDYLYTNCEKCQQKLRYSAERVGRAGVCPRCRRGLVFPAPSADETAGGPWWKDWSWVKKLWRSA